jgi:hypothetical protein
VSALTDIPDWVYDLVAGIHRYEDEHPLLYRMTTSGKYERTPCVDGLTSLIPRDISDATELLVARGAIVPRSMFPADEPLADWERELLAATDEGTPDA